jgi:deazaflavin-dependent oxidoreductase (nitroreductase family)
MGLMKSVVNPLTGLLLRSPLHRLMRGVMLITVTGRKTGRRYTTPVQFARDGDTIYVLTSADRSWWHNARDRAPVTLRLRGATRTGSAEAFPATAEIAAPALTAFRGTSLERGMGRLGARAVVVSIDLDPGATR